MKVTSRIVTAMHMYYFMIRKEVHFPSLEDDSWKLKVHTATQITLVHGGEMKWSRHQACARGSHKERCWKLGKPTDEIKTRYFPCLWVSRCCLISVKIVTHTSGDYFSRLPRWDLLAYEKFCRISHRRMKWPISMDFDAMNKLMRLFTCILQLII